MSDASFTPDPSALASALAPAGLAQDAATTLQRMVLIAQGGIARRAPVVTGRLRRSIAGRVVEVGRRGVVGTNLIYAPSVNRRRHFFEAGLDDVGPQLDAEAAALGGRFIRRVDG